MIAQQFEELKARVRGKSLACDARMESLTNGGALIKVTNVDLGPGWNRPTGDVIFVAPPGYPNAPPDCFWVEPNGLRLANGATPQNTNDSNAIPGDNVPGRSTTWFSWHIQVWNPNKDSLLGFYHLILTRLRPAR
jgi:hypothetical protein